MPAPDTWSAYYRRAAADEAALGNDRAAAACLRDARRADVATELARMTVLFQQRAITAAMGFGPTSLPAVGTQDADRHLAGGVRAPGTFFDLNQLNHSGVNSPVSGA